MAKLLQFSIGGRITIGFCLVVAMLLAQGIFGNAALQLSATRFQTYVSVDKTINEIHEIEYNVMDLQRSVLIYTFSGYEGIVSRIRKIQDTLRQQFSTVKPIIKDNERIDIIQRMEGHFQSYVENFDAALSERHLRDNAFDNKVAADANIIFDYLSNMLGELVSQSDNRTAALVGIAQDKFFRAHQEALLFQQAPDSALVHECENNIREFRERLDIIRTSATSEAIKGTILSIQADAAHYLLGFQSMVRASRAYLNLVYVVMPGEAVEFSRLAADLRERSLKIKGDLSSDIHNSVQLNLKYSLIFSSIAVFAAALFAWLISRGISRPVVAMTKALTDLAGGKRETAIPGRGRSDEIGAMAKAADVFKQKAEELDQANRYKSQFLAMMSHEIRTPKTSVLGVADLLRRTELTDEQSGYLEILKSTTKSLLTILNDILDISKLEAGKIEIEAEAFQLHSTVQEVVSLTQGTASKKGLTLELSISDDVPTVVVGDQTRAKQILYNLVSNAIKFTEQGRICVRISVKERKAGTAVVFTQVDDTGIGIDYVQLPKLFREFSQADQSTTRRFGGTGLGLAISKKLVELMGGQIGVESEHNNGARFWFTIPYTIRELKVSEQTKIHVVAIHDVAMRPIRILLAEDNKINQMLVRSMLQKLGHAVVVAGNGREALESVIAEDFDVVLMDMQMPEMDGEEATKAIRSLPPPKNLIPILALTADVMPENRDRYMQAGINGLVPKPIDWKVLSDAMDAHINNNHPSGGAVDLNQE